MKKILIASVLINLLSLSAFTQTDSSAEEASIIDFSSIKELIKQDGLEKQLEKKQESVKVQEVRKQINDTNRFNVPSENNFWSFFSEYWLVKNAQIIKWDFQKPDYDLENALKELLESQGQFEKKFKILLIDTPDLIHAALPADNNEFIFLISFPFVRSLDLSKVEIALILFEDYLRAKNGYLKNYISTPELQKFIGSNFKNKKFYKALIDKHLKRYNEKLFEKGFTFQEQFDVTMEMNTLLKPNPIMWNTYYKLIEKIDVFTKDSALYKKYSVIYPSPELKLNWLRPKNTRM